MSLFDRLLMHIRIAMMRLAVAIIRTRTFVESTTLYYKLVLVQIMRAEEYAHATLLLTAQRHRFEISKRPQERAHVTRSSWPISFSPVLRVNNLEVGTSACGR